MHSVHGEAPGLEGLDLNLLVALDALLRHRSVTRAARELRVTQPAASHALTRLRGAFGDPLLVRAGAGMVPTPRAEALAGPLRAALMGLARAIAEPARFDPAITRRVFRVATPDLFDSLVLPKVVRRMAATAPGASLAVATEFSRLGELLGSGELDVAVVPFRTGADGGPMVPDLPAGLRTRRLFADTFRPFVRRGHPALRARRLGPKAFAVLDHVLVSPSGRGGGAVDAVLRAEGLERRIALRVPQFASAIAVVQESDLVLVAPGSLALQGERFGLVELPVTFTSLGHALHLVWHPRFDADPGQAWFRGLLVECAPRVNPAIDE